MIHREREREREEGGMNIVWENKRFHGRMCIVCIQHLCFNLFFFKFHIAIAQFPIWIFQLNCDNHFLSFHKLASMASARCSIAIFNNFTALISMWMAIEMQSLKLQLAASTMSKLKHSICCACIWPIVLHIHSANHWFNYLLLRGNLSTKFQIWRLLNLDSREYDTKFASTKS